MTLAVLRLLFLSDVVGILRAIPHGLQLKHEPVVRQLRRDAGLPGLRARIADNQLLRLDGDRLGAACLPETLGAPQDQRLAFRLPENPGLRQRRLQTHGGRFRKSC